jgi:hypothetical protein
MWKRQSRKNDPYLMPGRLPEVLAAMQTMAILDRYRLPPDKWADLISGDASKGSYWEGVFNDHPEFFRVSSIHPG